MTDDLLIVTSPRSIFECLSSLSSIECDKAWAIGYTEPELEPVIAEIVEGSSYDRYTIVSDDVVVTPGAFRAVVDEVAEDPWSVYTGWTNLDCTAHGLKTSSVVRTPFTAYASVPEQYDWIPISEVLDGPRVQRTPFAGACLTCMTREKWLEFPYQVFRGEGPSSGTGSSDFQLSWRLQEAGIRVYAVRDSMVFHVKEVTTEQDQEPRKALRWLGEDAHVRWDPA